MVRCGRAGGSAGTTARRAVPLAWMAAARSLLAPLGMQLGCSWVVIGYRSVVLTFCCCVACSQYKLCRIVKSALGPRGVPYLVTHDGRTIRYPQPDIYVNDTAKVDIESGRIVDSFKFEVGQVVMITGGHNVGRVGQLIQREKHLGSYEIAHIKDTAGKMFSTRASNVFIIGEGNKASITLPKGKGIKLTILEEAAMRS